jgi:hypothetical protein
MSEKEVQALDRSMSEMITTITEAIERIKELEAYSDNLLSYIVRLSNTFTISPGLHFELQEIAKQSPQYSIKKIKADAIRETARELDKLYTDCDVVIELMTNYADELEGKSLNHTQVYGGDHS